MATSHGLPRLGVQCKDIWTDATLPPGQCLFPISPNGVPSLLSERFRRSKRSKLPPKPPPPIPESSGRTSRENSANEESQAVQMFQSMPVQHTEEAGQKGGARAVRTLTRPSRLQARVVHSKSRRKYGSKLPSLGGDVGMLGIGSATGTTTRAESPSNMNAAAQQGVSGGSGGGEGAGRRGKDKDEEQVLEAQAVTLDPEESYKPFTLSQKSSFNPSSMSERQLGKLDRLTRAKYGAYEKPEAQISQQIDQSRARAKQWTKYEREKLRDQIYEIQRMWERKRGHVGELEERKGQEAARRATERMRGKIRSIMASRDNELQFLVEGQRNAIDAIRLKEFLVLRTPNVKLGRQYSDKDRLRVEELLGSAIP
ncbi:hypothetical protein HDU67_008530 [Dinochytrium kinnereticum]|nr:hypothetical protein HDU67_008530 [Dinochytrium kinnereticum]